MTFDGLELRFALRAQRDNELSLCNIGKIGRPYNQVVTPKHPGRKKNALIPTKQTNKRSIISLVVCTNSRVIYFYACGVGLCQLVSISINNCEGGDIEY